MHVWAEAILVHQVEKPSLQSFFTVTRLGWIKNVLKTSFGHSLSNPSLNTGSALTKQQIYQLSASLNQHCRESTFFTISWRKWPPSWLQRVISFTIYESGHYSYNILSRSSAIGKKNLYICCILNNILVYKDLIDNRWYVLTLHRPFQHVFQGHVRSLGHKTESLSLWRIYYGAVDIWVRDHGHDIHMAAIPIIFSSVFS